MIDWVHKESVTQANVCDTCGHQYSDICGTCESLDGVPVQYKVKTNEDTIKSMSTDDLANFLEVQIWDLPWCDADVGVHPETKRCKKWDCVKCCKKWLQKEADHA